MFEVLDVVLVKSVFSLKPKLCLGALLSDANHQCANSVYKHTEHLLCFTFSSFLIV